MPTIGDYLDLRVAQAVDQWRSMLRRTPKPGARQEDFTPVEILLCLTVSLVFDHRGTADRPLTSLKNRSLRSPGCSGVQTEA